MPSRKQRCPIEAGRADHVQAPFLHAVGPGRSPPPDGKLQRTLGLVFRHERGRCDRLLTVVICILLSWRSGNATGTLATLGFVTRGRPYLLLGLVAVGSTQGCHHRRTSAQESCRPALDITGGLLNEQRPDHFRPFGGHCWRVFGMITYEPGAKARGAIRSIRKRRPRAANTGSGDTNPSERGSPSCPAPCVPSRHPRRARSFQGADSRGIRPSVGPSQRFWPLSLGVQPPQLRGPAPNRSVVSACSQVRSLARQSARLIVYKCYLTLAFSR